MPRRILSLFRNLFRKRAIERALDDELRSTLEALMQEKMEQGLSQSVARREALIEIGGIEQVIHAMFDGISKRDAVAIKAPTLPGGTMVLMRDGKPTQMTFEAFAERVGKPGTIQIEERIHNSLVRIDNDLAVVWARFDFLVDGKVDRGGTDLFNLVHVDGKRMIASVADTGTKTCFEWFTPGGIPRLFPIYGHSGCGHRS